MNYKDEFIKFMVRSGVLVFGDFITKSGRKTPYFVNTGNYKTGLQASRLGEFYSNCIIENINLGHISNEVNTLFGPAYKGIPLSVATAICLATKHERNLNYCFNRKEIKDHGEGGNIVGHKLRDGDRILIIEDVITAGTAVRECLPIIKSLADVKIEGLVVSVDRMEKGQGESTAIQELNEELGIPTYPIVNVREIIKTLHGAKIDGRVIMDDTIKSRMEEYLEMYCI